MDMASVSVIVPTLNEAECIAGCIAHLRHQGAEEIIVADGGSTDDTPRFAGGADLVLVAPRGRANQMNAGAARARGEILLFLHADCVLEREALTAAQALLERGRIVAGCFTMRVAEQGLLFRWIDAFAAARVRFSGIVYGDQGLFLRRRDFEKLGGFPAVPILEDVLFTRRLATMGKVAVASKRIFVSPRRWQRVGVVRQTIRNWSILARAVWGASPEALAAAYPPLRSASTREGLRVR